MSLATILTPRHLRMLAGNVAYTRGASYFAAGNVLFSLLGFALFYSALLVADVYLLLKYIRLGPETAPPEEAA